MTEGRVRSSRSAPRWGALVLPVVAVLIAGCTQSPEPAASTPRVPPPAPGRAEAALQQPGETGQWAGVVQP